MNWKKITRRTLWTLLLVVALPMVALAHLHLTELIATLAWYLLVAAATVTVGTVTLVPLGGRMIGGLRALDARQRWRVINLGLTALAGALISALLTRRSLPHLPELYRLYWLVVAWAAIIGVCTYGVSTSWRHWMNVQAASFVRIQLRYNNNARWCLLAFLALNATILAIFYGLPFSVLSPSEIITRASSGVNEVWGACRGTVGFILYGDRNAFGFTLVSAVAVSDVASMAKGWTHACVALVLIFATLVYLPKAFADEVLGWLRRANDWLRARRRTEGETRETPAARPSGGFSWQHLVASIGGFLGLEAVVDALISVVSKKASS